MDLQQIRKNICYTDLVYERINKKLNAMMSKEQIEKLIMQILTKAPIQNYTKIGKNYYVISTVDRIRITINSNTFRVITVDKL